MPPIESISCRWPVAAMPIGMSCKTGCAWSVMALIPFGRAKNNALAGQRMHEGSTGCTTDAPGSVERSGALNVGCAGVMRPEGEIHVASEGFDRALGGGAGAGRLRRDAGMPGG